jgi:hypothetical protein
MVRVRGYIYFIILGRYNAFSSIICINHFDSDRHFIEACCSMAEDFKKGIETSVYHRPTRKPITFRGWEHSQ